MRERVGDDWVTDLSGRHTLEGDVEQALRDFPGLRLVHVATSSRTQLDFLTFGPGGRMAPIELKAKLQPYRGWSELAPSIVPENLFTLDELALRKVVEAGRYAFLLIWDDPIGRWCVWSSLDLVLASKVRVGRPVGPDRIVKGKVLLDLEEAAHTCTDLTAALDAITEDLELCDTGWSAITPWPYGPEVANPLLRKSS